MVGCVSGCVGTAGCHTLLHLCKPVLSVGTPSLQEGSVKSVGELFWLRGVYPPTEQTGRRCSPTDCTDQHRWLVALVGAWVRQDAIPSYICVNPCYLWETLLYKKVLCRSVKSVGELFWLRGVYPPTEQTGRRCSPTDCTDQHRWLVALVGAWVRQDAIPSYICVNPCYLWETLLYKKVLCRSVKSVGENHSEKVL